MRQAVAQIVDVKQQREDTAQEAQRRARLTLEDAARRLERARQDLTQYGRWRVGEESRLWDAIEGRLVKVDDIDALKGEIGLLRGREQQLAEATVTAERSRETAHKAATDAETAYEAAVRARQKFEELADMLDAEWRAEQERKEELELEEQVRVRALDLGIEA